jgi:hypothetical protein
MHICWVGGLDRSVDVLERAAAEAGHTLEAHTGRVGGRGSERLARSIERSELVVIVIEVNSHGAALQAKELARRAHRATVTIRKGSVAALQRILRASADGSLSASA